MKRSVFCLTSLFILLLGTSRLQAQYYSFSQLNQSYQSTVNPQFVISDSINIDTSAAMVVVDYHYMQPKAFGENMSGLMQVGPDGSLVATGINSDFIFDPFFTDLRALGTSEFRATELIQGNDTIFEMEWYEFGLVGAPNTDFITMKLRFYLTKELIEFHYGPSQVTPSHTFPFGPYVGIFLAYKGFSAFKAVMMLTGNPLSPTMVTSSVPTMSTFPPSGTVYRFSGPQVTSISENQIENLDLKVFPNPTRGNISLDSRKRIAEVKVTNNMGQEVYQQKGMQSNKVDLELNLPAGTYFILTTFIDGSLPNTKKIIVK